MLPHVAIKRTRLPEPWLPSNRTVHLQPNTGDISDEGLLARLKANAADGIYTTLIGVHARQQW